MYASRFRVYHHEMAGGWTYTVVDNNAPYPHYLPPENGRFMESFSTEKGAEEYIKNKEGNQNAWKR